MVDIQMKIGFRKRRESSILVLLLLIASFVMVGTFNPAHATNPVVANAATGVWAAGTTFTVVLTVAAVGDQVAVFGGERCQTANCVNGFIGAGTTSPGVTGGFNVIDGIHSTCIGSPTDGQCGGVTGQNWDSNEVLWVGTATSSGAITITLTLASNSLNQAGGVAYDVQFASTTPTFADSSCNAVAHSSCVSPIPSLLTSNAAQVSMAGVIGWSSIVDATGGCTFASASGAKAGAFINGAGSCGFDFTGFSGFETGFAMVAAIFPSPGAVTVTSVINTGCLGPGCSGSANATSTYFSVGMPNLFVFYQSQNTGSVSQVDNFTMKIKATHFTTNVGNLLVLVYEPATPTSPASGVNLWTLVPNTGTTTVQVANNTVDKFIHANLQTPICSLCFYAVGIMATTTASRGSGAVGSGVSFYESSTIGFTQFSFDMGGTTPANTFFSNTIKKPNFFMFIHTTFTVATVTSTSTLSVGGTATTTISTTTTFSSLDAASAIQFTTTDVILLIVIFGPAMLMLGAIAFFTRSAFGAGIGFVAGLMVGTGIGVQAQLVPPAFLGVTVIVGIFLIVGLARGGGGGSL